MKIDPFNNHSDNKTEKRTDQGHTISKLEVMKILEEEERFNSRVRSLEHDVAMFVAVENTIRRLKHRIGDLVNE